MQRLATLSDAPPAAADLGPALSVDLGTSNTVAVGRLADGRVRPLLFDGSPTLPSAVYVDDDGRMVTGADAWHCGRSQPARLEPHPKLRIDDGTVLLGDREVAVVDLFTAVLARVATEARTSMGTVPTTVVLTHPAAWGPHRRRVLTRAAEAAGLGAVRMVSEPIAAALLRRPLPHSSER